MAIANYTDLQAAIADYLARADLTTRIPDFITLAESHFNRELRTREMVAVSSITISGGAVVIPADFIEWIGAQWFGTRVEELEFSEANSARWRFRYRPNGDPAMFTIRGNQIVIRPIADGSLLLTYYQQIPPLASVSTNWLLTKCPDLYLYRSLAEAYIFQKNETRAAEFLTLADAETKKATGAADANKISPGQEVQQPSDGAGIP